MLRVSRAFRDQAVRDGFQVSDSNPLVGVEGRADLLRGLGALLASKPEIFGRNDAPRPGGLFDQFLRLQIMGRSKPRRSCQNCCITSGRSGRRGCRLAGSPLGDCWRHPSLITADATNWLVPLHKLSQWLAYSLIEPLQTAGIKVTDIDGLTGLAEYRNGGLFIDTGVLAFANAADAQREHEVTSALVVEWRALTVALLDRLAEGVRERLGLDAVIAAARQGTGRRILGRGPAARARTPRRRLTAGKSHQRRHGVLSCRKQTSGFPQRSC